MYNKEHSQFASLDNFYLHVCLSSSLHQRDQTVRFQFIYCFQLSCVFFFRMYKISPPDLNFTVNILEQ